MAERAQEAAEVVPEEVSRLLEERTRVRGWLEKLADLEEDSIPEVYGKVRADYGSRLEDVNGRLLSHRSELESSLVAHEERAETLQAERNERAAELEEGRLRHLVGEYDEETWDELREAAEAAIQKLDGELKKESAALDSIRATLAALSEGPEASSGAGAPAAATPPAAAEAADSPAAAEADDAQASAADARTPRAEAGAEARPKVAREMEGEGGGEEGEGAEGREDADFLDELEFLESLSLEDADRFDAVSAMLEGEEKEERA